MDVRKDVQGGANVATLNCSVQPCVHVKVNAMRKVIYGDGMFIETWLALYFNNIIVVLF